MTDPVAGGPPGVVVWIFVAAGLLFAVLGVAAIANSIRTAGRHRSWTAAQAVLDRLELRQATGERHTRPWMQASYHYRDAQGGEHRGQGRIPAAITFGSQAERRALDILYDPAHPERSMPQAQGGGMTGIVMGAVLAAFGLGFALFALTVFGSGSGV